MISEGYRTNRDVSGPMNFKKSGRFFRKVVLPRFWGPDCHLNTLIGLANTALVSKDLVETI